MKYLTATEAKKRFLELVRTSDEQFDRYCITRNGEPKAILMSIDEYESWLETLEITSSPRAVAEIRRAKAELKSGKGIPLTKVLESLRG